MYKILLRSAILSTVLTGCSNEKLDLLTPATGGDIARPNAVNKTAAVNKLGGVTRTSSVNYKGPLRVVKTLPSPSKTKGGLIQLISPNDLLEITFFGVEKLDRTVRVGSRGLISLPLIGEVTAVDKSVRQLEKELERTYGAKYLQSPQITINTKESFGQRVTVDGEVKTPGIYPVSAGSTLVQVISQAHGYTAIGDPSKVFIFRNVGGERLAARYNLESIRAGRQRDPRIYGGDVVVTFESTTKVAMENLRTVLGLARTGVGLALLP